MSAVKQMKNATQTDNIKLTRRSFLAAVGTSVAGLAFQRISTAAEKNVRPNIIFIMVDDLGKEWISCYGAEDIETPNLDALAASGNTVAAAAVANISRIHCFVCFFTWAGISSQQKLENFSV